MLFNSYLFLFVFLPVVTAGFFVAGRLSAGSAKAWLVLSSLVFYSCWDWHFTFVLFASILFNYGAGRLLARLGTAPARQRLVLAGAVTVDLAVLGFFKYINFLLDNVGALLGLHVVHAGVALPIGISFFTFTQVAYIVDVARARARERAFVPYVLFVTYFPHLVAGPILHHAEMMPQFARRETYRPHAEAIAVGLTVFVAGLFKKVLLADGIAFYADNVFRAAGTGHALTPLAAWCGALAYTFQIYFDFSAYSDMAIGLSRVFNITLPINFDSPYQARSIIDFWRRWHITLSRFLRDYLYVALGGNRKGVIRRYINLAATMLLGGLWHGAGWTFVIWGGLHGCYLVINHFWRHLTATMRAPAVIGPLLRCVGWTITFLAVVFAWVFFRAPNLATAMRVVDAMAGQTENLPPARVIDLWVFAWLPGLAAIALLLPNLRHVMAGHELVSFAGTALPPNGSGGRLAASLRWTPKPALAVFTLGVFTYCLNAMQKISQFLYFQF